MAAMSSSRSARAHVCRRFWCVADRVEHVVESLLCAPGTARWRHAGILARPDLHRPDSRRRARGESTCLPVAARISFEMRDEALQARGESLLPMMDQVNRIADGPDPPRSLWTRAFDPSERPCRPLGSQGTGGPRIRAALAGTPCTTAGCCRSTGRVATARH
jgi:hypothetical protein